MKIMLLNFARWLTVHTPRNMFINVTNSRSCMWVNVLESIIVSGIIKLNISISNQFFISVNICLVWVCGFQLHTLTYAPTNTPTP